MKLTDKLLRQMIRESLQEYDPEYAARMQKHWEEIEAAKRQAEKEYEERGCTLFGQSAKRKGQSAKPSENTRKETPKPTNTTPRYETIRTADGKVYRKRLKESAGESAPLDKHLFKILRFVLETDALLDSKCVDRNSTWQLPYEVEYMTQEINGRLYVTRTVQEDTYYHNNGMEVRPKPERDRWILTPRNWKEKWEGEYKDGLKYILKDDLKCCMAYKRSHGLLEEGEYTADDELWDKFVGTPEYIEWCQDQDMEKEEKERQNMKKNSIKLTESQLQQVIKESVKKVLNEGQSDGNPIEKWNYWCANYHHDFIQKAWADDPLMAKHLEGKFAMYYEQEGSYGVMNKFYLNLDYENRRILEDYVMNNY